MRILIVNKFARVTGGADAYCIDIARAMRARGHEVAFLSTGHPTNIESEGAFVPATVTRADRDSLNPLRQLRAASSSFWNGSAYNAAQDLLRVFRPHVVSAHKLYPQLSVSPLVAARRAQVPVVQTVHDYEFISASPFDHTGGWLDRKETSIRFRALNSSLFPVKLVVHRRSVARWIAVSEFVAGRLRSRGIEARVLPNPAPSLDERRVSFRGRRGLAFAGRLSPEKGITHVLKLAELVPEIDIHVAGDGPTRATVEEAAARLPNLHYRGSIARTEIADMFGCAIAVIVPSLWQEPGAVVVLEAMAAGTPVLAYNVGGIAEYITNAGAGMVVEPQPEALAAAYATLLSDPKKWERLSRSGAVAASGAHSLDTHCTGLERVFGEAIGAEK